MNDPTPATVQLLPVDRITVPNPRERDRKAFREIVESISKVGLKQPITVTRTSAGATVPEYVLVCGQGRLEAFVALGEDQIPAVVIDATQDDCMLMSLVENIARRQHRAKELFEEIDRLSKRGYTNKQVAKKIGVSFSYVCAMRSLMKKGEERLLAAVESGQVAVNVAVAIAGQEDGDVQALLAEFYQKGIRGGKLMRIKRLIERRERFGKAAQNLAPERSSRPLSVAKVFEVLEREAEQRRVTVKRAELVRTQLTFAVTAMRTFLKDENFKTLLRAERLETMPQALAELVMDGES